MIVKTLSTNKPSPRKLSRTLLPALAVALCAALIGAAAASAAVPRTFFGISAVRPSPNDYSGMASRVGAGSVRIEIGWPSVQASKHAAFNWNGIDQRFRRAAAFGLRPLPIVFGTPSFIDHDPDHVTAPVHGKAERKQWQNFVRAAAQRYGPGGEFWRQSPALDSRLAPKNWLVWNEQNARAYWYPKASPKQYARLLRVSRKAFDDVDPDILITTGGMFGYPENKHSMKAKKFLKRLYRQRGAKAAIDAVSIHPYAGNIKAVKKQVKDARFVMNQAGDHRAKLLIGEIGWASGGHPKNYFLIKNKKIQKRLLQKSYKLLLHKRKRWGIVGAYWFTYRDSKDDPVCNWCPKAGLLNKHGKFKPAGHAYKRLVAKKTG